MGRVLSIALAGLLAACNAAGGGGGDGGGGGGWGPCTLAAAEHPGATPIT